MTEKLLKEAADQLEAYSTELEAAQKKLAEVEAKLADATAQTKTASDKSADAKAELAGLAKTAADKLLEHGLLSNAEKRDAFAASVTDHATALTQITKLAGYVTVQKLGTVVADEHIKTASADDVWSAHAHKALARSK